MRTVAPGDARRDDRGAVRNEANGWGRSIRRGLARRPTQPAPRPGALRGRLVVMRTSLTRPVSSIARWGRRSPSRRWSVHRPQPIRADTVRMKTLLNQ